LRARFYNPVIGRFTQEDVYRGDGLNLYAYCGNNPVGYYDPSGYYCASKEDTFNSTYDERIGQTPKSNGSWEDVRGESKFISSNPEVNEVLAKYGMDGVEYTNGIPNFTKAAWGGDIVIKNMQGGEYGRASNFAQAYAELSNKTGMPVKELKSIAKDFELTWHECNDMKTMQLIPTIINGKFGHLGGVGEINRGI